MHFSSFNSAKHRFSLIQNISEKIKTMCQWIVTLRCYWSSLLLLRQRNSHIYSEEGWNVFNFTLKVYKHCVVTLHTVQAGDGGEANGLKTDSLTTTPLLVQALTLLPQIKQIQASDREWWWGECEGLWLITRESHLKPCNSLLLLGRLVLLAAPVWAPHFTHTLWLYARIIYHLTFTPFAPSKGLNPRQLCRSPIHVFFMVPLTFPLFSPQCVSDGL